jgi:hypothetical protein
VTQDQNNAFESVVHEALANVHDEVAEGVRAQGHAAGKRQVMMGHAVRDGRGDQNIDAFLLKLHDSPLSRFKGTESVGSQRKMRPMVLRGPDDEDHGLEAILDSLVHLPPGHLVDHFGSVNSIEFLQIRHEKKYVYNLIISWDARPRVYCWGLREFDAEVCQRLYSYLSAICV